jgi:hypothetical protein
MLEAVEGVREYMNEQEDIDGSAVGFADIKEHSVAAAFGIPYSPHVRIVGMCLCVCVQCVFCWIALSRFSPCQLFTVYCASYLLFLLA